MLVHSKKVGVLVRVTFCMNVITQYKDSAVQVTKSKNILCLVSQNGDGFVDSDAKMAKIVKAIEEAMTK